MAFQQAVCIHAFISSTYAVWLPLVAGAALFALLPSSSISSSCVCVLSPHQHIWCQDLFLLSITFEVCQGAVIHLPPFVNSHLFEA